MAKKTINLTEFVRKLQRQMNQPQPRFQKTITLGAFDQEIVLESISEEELENINANQPAAEQDMELVYRGSPTLREAANELMKLEAIDDPMEVFKPFKRSDINAMAKIVGELTTQAMQPTVKEIEEIKN